jgi:hypothetical protein
VSWLRRQQSALGLTVDADVDSVEQEGMTLVAAELVEVIPAYDPRNPNVTESGPKGSDAPRLILAPLERLAVPHALSGSDGENRSTAFC